MTVNVQGDATDRKPVLYDISYLIQYILDIKAKFILPVNGRSLLKQNCQLHKMPITSELSGCLESLQRPFRLS